MTIILIILLAGILLVLGIIVWQLIRIGHRGSKQSSISVRRLGPYKVLEVLGGGGFATVYRAFDKQKKREVALKVMHERKAGDDLKDVEKFLSEAKILSRIHESCPDAAVPRVYASGELDGRPFISMELVQGRSLQDVLQEKRRLEADHSSQFIAGICDVLAKIHSLDIWHRDLDPRNVMVDQNGRILLIDFGIAKATHSVSFTVKGKADYMAPETSRNPSAVLDVYSLGCLWYALLTGNPPFHHDDPFEAMRMNREDPVPPLPGAVPSQISAMIGRMLAKEPSHRYSDVRLLSKGLGVPPSLVQLRASVLKRGVLPNNTEPKPVSIRKANEGASRKPSFLIGTAVLLFAMIGGGGMRIRLSASS